MTGLSNRPAAIRREFDLIMGSNALAQLMNNNIFFGRIKALDSIFVTLTFGRGEVSLPLEDVRVLTHLARDEFKSLKNQGTAGSIYLRNNNRLRGIIVAQRDDSVILQVKSNRVMIPKSAIEHIQTQPNDTVQFAEDDTVETDDWVRQLVEERLNKAPKDRKRGTVYVEPKPPSIPPKPR